MNDSRYRDSLIRCHASSSARRLVPRIHLLTGLAAASACEYAGYAGQRSANEADAVAHSTCSSDRMVGFVDATTATSPLPSNHNVLTLWTRRKACGHGSFASA